MRFTLRDGGRTLGYGVVTDMLDEINIEDYEKQRKVEKKQKRKEEEANAGY